MAPERPVIHLTERWLPASETFVHELVTRLARPGVVVSIRPPDDGGRFPFRPLVRLPRVLDRLPGPLHRRAMTASLLAVAARHRAAIVHVHHGYRAYEAVGLARRARLPLVVSLHGHDVTGHVRARPGVYAGVLDRADAVIVPSRFLAALAVEAGAPEGVLHVIPAGVDTSLFAPSPLPARPEVLFVGRFVDKKGLDVLVDAWPAVRGAVPGATLRLLGFGPLEGLARRAGPGTEVVVSPDRAAVAAAMRRARVVVSPSRTATGDESESLLLVNLEAQASGRPVVTTDHGGVPEFVKAGETALVVPEGDAAALAAAVTRLLEDDDLATRVATAGPAWAARFDAGEAARRVDDLYDALLAARG